MRFITAADCSTLVRNIINISIRENGWDCTLTLYYTYSLHLSLDHFPIINHDAAKIQEKKEVYIAIIHDYFIIFFFFFFLS